MLSRMFRGSSLLFMATTSCEDYHKRLFREYKDK